MKKDEKNEAHLETAYIPLSEKKKKENRGHIW